jgi:hypothetical protein
MRVISPQVLPPPVPARRRLHGNPVAEIDTVQRVALRVARVAENRRPQRPWRKTWPVGPKCGPRQSGRAEDGFPRAPLQTLALNGRGDGKPRQPRRRERRCWGAVANGAARKCCCQQERDHGCRFGPMRMLVGRNPKAITPEASLSLPSTRTRQRLYVAPTAHWSHSGRQRRS